MKKKRKMEKKHKNVENKRENVYIYIFLSNAHFLLIYYVNKNISTFLLYN